MPKITMKVFNLKGMNNFDFLLHLTCKKKKNKTKTMGSCV